MNLVAISDAEKNATMLSNVYDFENNQVCLDFGEK
jgi:hypothetical protein